MMNELMKMEGCCGDVADGFSRAMKTFWNHVALSIDPAIPPIRGREDKYSMDRVAIGMWR
jgi:hypothetical protein